MIDAPTSDRFTIHRKLGSGGMGVVYEAFDRQRNAVVALKTLRVRDAPALYRFKREFRALADIRHRNLITLYELIAVDDEWLFTMELVRGANLLRHVRPGRDPEHDTESMTERPPAPADEEFITNETRAIALAPASGPDEASIERLRDGLRQLAEGVAFLHGAGRLHRDIKPSNVLVEADTDRVVLCDFGLVAEMRGRSAYETARTPGGDHLVGTVAFMSPEQAKGHPLTEASDWYSVGVVLYQALTGTVPFLGPQPEMLRLKCDVDPPRPSALVPDTPPDLDQLCVDLLRREAEARPPGAEVLRRLGAGRTAWPAAPPPSQRAFVGRDAPLAELDRALGEVRDGASRAVLITGPSGMGKTSLVRQFLTVHAPAIGSLVLAGRCYHNEALPYKAFDNVIDELSSWLAHLHDGEAAPLIPEDAGALARLFPVLRRVPAIDQPDRPRLGEHDKPLQSRRRGFAALRELFARIGQRMLVTVFIDDLHWGDADSAALLRALLDGDDPPRMLVMATYRSEDEDTNPVLAQLRDALDQPALATRTLRVTPLSDAEASDLARGLLRDRTQRERIAAIARESGGHPLLVNELARGQQVAGAARDGSALIALDDLLRARIEDLPASSRDILTAIAVYGRPVPEHVLEDIAAPRADWAAELGRLAAGNLVRYQSARREAFVETFHDRVREVAVGLLGERERRAYHARIATALQRLGDPDPEMLVQHWLAAGEHARAGAAAVAAADQAQAALAFDRAARLYAIALQSAPSEHAGPLRARRADVLLHAGRGVEAAGEYLAAARDAPAARALALEAAAAQAYLTSGRLDDGLATLSRLMESQGMRLATTHRRAILSLIWRRLHLRLRGLAFQPRDETQVAPEQLARVDLGWTAASGLGMADTMRAAEYQSRHLLLALETGEPNRIARAATLEIAFLSVMRVSRQRARKVVRQIAPLFDEQVRSPFLRALFVGAQAMVHYQSGEFRPARELGDECLRVMDATTRGMSWERFNGELYRLWACYYLGDVGEVADRARELYRDAVERGDVYAASSISVGVTAIAALLDTGDAAALGDAAERSMSAWSKRGFHLQHVWAASALAHRDLYVGDGAAALARLDAIELQMRRHFLMRIDMLRMEFLHARSRAALVAAMNIRDARARAELLRRARRDARALQRGNVISCRPLGTAVLAGVAAARGAHDEAVALLQRAAGQLDDAGLAAFAAAARWQLDRLAGSGDGAAAERLRALGVADPPRAAATQCPISVA